MPVTSTLPEDAWGVGTPVTMLSMPDALLARVTWGARKHAALQVHPTSLSKAHRVIPWRSVSCMEFLCLFHRSAHQWVLGPFRGPRACGRLPQCPEAGRFGSPTRRPGPTRSACSPGWRQADGRGA